MRDGSAAVLVEVQKRRFKAPYFLRIIILDKEFSVAEFKKMYTGDILLVTPKQKSMERPKR